MVELWMMKEVKQEIRRRACQGRETHGPIRSQQIVASSSSCFCPPSTSSIHQRPSSHFGSCHRHLTFHQIHPIFSYSQCTTVLSPRSWAIWFGSPHLRRRHEEVVVPNVFERRRCCSGDAVQEKIQEKMRRRVYAIHIMRSCSLTLLNYRALMHLPHCRSTQDRCHRRLKFAKLFVT